MIQLLRAGFYITDVTVKHELTLSSNAGTVDDSYTATVMARDQFDNIVNENYNVSVTAINTVLIPGDNGEVKGDGILPMSGGKATAILTTKVPGTIAVKLSQLFATVDESDTDVINVLEGN